MAFDSETSDSQATSVLSQAIKNHVSEVKEKYRLFMQEEYNRVSNPVLDCLPSVNGITKFAFLDRMLTAVHSVSHSSESVKDSLDDLLEHLREAKIEKQVTSKSDCLRRLCQVLEDNNNTSALVVWLSENSLQFNKTLANCFDLENSELAEAACFTVALVIRKFYNCLSQGVEVIVAAMVRLMSLAMLPWESYVEQYREAKERHADVELVRQTSVSLHFPHLQMSYAECHHRLISCLYYSLADLIYNASSPGLIHFFTCRIYKRKETTRTLLFNIQYSLVACYNEMCSRSERILRQSSQDDGVLERRMQAENTAWRDLPGILITEFERLSNDRNRCNRMRIKRINSLLHSQVAKIAEEETLKLESQNRFGLRASDFPKTKMSDRFNNSKKLRRSTISDKLNNWGLINRTSRRKSKLNLKPLNIQAPSSASECSTESELEEKYHFSLNSKLPVFSTSSK